MKTRLKPVSDDAVQLFSHEYACPGMPRFSFKSHNNSWRPITGCGLLNFGGAERTSV